MTKQGVRSDRRTILRTTGAVVGGMTLAGCLNDGSSDGDQFVEEEPDYGGWFDDVDDYEGTLDRRGEEEVRVMVGTGDDGLQFDPPAILVDHLTTVVWEWTGNGTHNVVHEPGSGEDRMFESELLSDEGETYEYTFNHEMVYRYYCEPHRNLGMKGAVAVEH